MTIMSARTDSHSVPSVVVPDVANALARRYDGSPQPDKGDGANIVVTQSAGIYGEVSETLDAHYYLGCGARNGREREVIFEGLPTDRQTDRQTDRRGRR